MSAELKIQHIADTNVDDAKESLVPLLEFALVEDLNGDNRVVLHGADVPSEHRRNVREQDAHVETLIPVGV